MQEKTGTRWPLILNAAIAVIFVLAWCQMIFGWSQVHAPLAALGLASLKYFTILSNLLSGIVSAACAVFHARNGGEPLPERLHTMRFIATTSVMLTLLTVELFLAPAFYGYPAMHAGANLWFHLVLPLMAIAGFCILEADRPIPLRKTLAATVPMVIYGAGYLANILINGIPGNDWYGFTIWGLERTPIVFAVMLAVTWLIACCLRAVNQRVYRSRLR